MRSSTCSTGDRVVECVIERLWLKHERWVERAREREVWMRVKVEHMNASERQSSLADRLHCVQRPVYQQEQQFEYSVCSRCSSALKRQRERTRWISGSTWWWSSATTTRNGAMIVNSISSSLSVYRIV